MNFTPLTPDHFAHKHWQSHRDSRHLQNQHWTAISAPELSNTAAHLPLVFVQTGPGQFQLAALMGLTANHNDCLGADNEWLLDYTPALLRVHPFKVQPTKEGSTERVLCVDANSPWIHAEATEPFFDEEGQLAPKVQEVLHFLMDLEKHLFLTQRAVNQLAKLKLLTPYNISNAQGQRLEGIYQIDEERFQQLPDAQLPVLRKSGALAIAYAQLISTGQMAALRRRAAHNSTATPANIDLDSFFDGKGETLRFDLL